MVWEFFENFCGMPAAVSRNLKIAAIQPSVEPGKSVGFTPRSLEVVFKDFAEKEKIEEYRTVMMKQRVEIQDERWKPQWQMSTCDEMRPRYVELQKKTCSIKMIFHLRDFTTQEILILT